MPTQTGLPTVVTPTEIARERTLGGAIELCAKAAGFCLDKQLQTELGVDKAQFSRWQSNQEGILWHKLAKLMDVCGNDAPVLWMLHQRNWDLASLRRRESELERQLRLKDEELEKERQENRLMRQLLGRPAA